MTLTRSLQNFFKMIPTQEESNQERINQRKEDLQAEEKRKAKLQEDLQDQLDSLTILWNRHVRALESLRDVLPGFPYKDSTLEVRSKKQLRRICPVHFPYLCCKEVTLFMLAVNSPDRYAISLATEVRSCEPVNTSLNMLNIKPQY